MHDPLHDSVVRASVYRERYSRGIYTQLINLLEDAELSTVAKIERRLKGLSNREREAFLAGHASTKRLQAIVEQIRELALYVRRTVNSEINVGIKELVEAELAFSRQLLTTVGLEAALGTGVSISHAYSLVKSKPMQGRFLREIVRDFEPKVRSRMMARIRTGLMTGTTTQEIARTLRDEFKVTHNLAKTITRTAATHTSAVTYLEMYKQAGAQKIIFKSTLDGRTSPYCRAQSNKIYDINKPHPVLPAHLNCRSVWVALIPGMDLSEMETPYVADKRSVSNIPKKERSKKIGKVSADTDYDTWLRRQSVSFQKDVLRKDEYRLFKKGLHLDKFVDSKTYKTYTIAELRKKYSDMFNDN